MLLKRFWRDRRGGVAPMLALAALPLMGSVGAAIDFSRAASARTAMQAALDSTALMLSRELGTIPAANLSAKANALFAAQFQHPQNRAVEVTVKGETAPNANSITMSAASTSPTQFMGIVGFQTVAIVARTATTHSFDGLGCVLALDDSASGSAAAQGSTSVVLKGCSIYANSKDPAAVSAGGSGRIEAHSVHAVGGVSGETNITTVSGIHSKSAPLTDPYADVSYPEFFGCTEQNFKANSDVTIDPGVYCGGILVNAGAVLSLNPGIYYLDGGSLTVNGGATITGTGVTLVFTSKNRNGWADARINGNATVWLTAPKTGPTAGIVMFGDRNMPADSTFKLNGGSTQYFGGAVYTPAALLEFSGGSNTGTSCTQIIVRRVTFTGNSAVALNCSNQGTRPFSVAINRILS
jgi:Flp pilus assembly protein TadG